MKSKKVNRCRNGPKINGWRHTPIQNVVFYISFLDNLQCISILFPVGHENLLSIWDTHCRFPFQPLEFTALDRTQWYSINWSIVIQFTKYEWTKSIYLKGWQEKRQSIHFLGLILKSKNPHISSFILAWDTLHDPCRLPIICSLYLFWISNKISYGLKYYWTFSNAK